MIDLRAQYNVRLKFDGYENEVLRKQHNLTCLILETYLVAKIIHKKNYEKLVYANLISALFNVKNKKAKANKLFTAINPCIYSNERQ